MPLLVRIVIAIVLGALLGGVTPMPVVRLFATFNGIFGNFLQFLIPLIIVGLVTPAIADVGKGVGVMLAATVLIAYGDTVVAGLLSFFTASNVFPALIDGGKDLVVDAGESRALPFFSIEMPPLMDVMSALVLALIMGIGIAFFVSARLKEIFEEFRQIVVRTIEVVVIPLLPVYIFGIFLIMAREGQVARVIGVFAWVIVVIFALHVLLLLLQYVVVGLLTGRNPLRLLWRMLPAYFTALGTSSSAATIPVTLKAAQSNGVSREVAGFVIPLCATIHLSGSCLKITACAVALMLMRGMPFEAGMFVGFVLLLGVMMVAAPGVPGGAIMAALGVLGSVLGFGEEEEALMIALYIAMDSFGTACNVTGDGAIAVAIERFFNKEGRV